jgi:hypothetical protein
VLVQPPELPGGGGIYRGFEGLRQALDEWLDASDYIPAEAERLAPGEDVVVVTVRLRSRRRHTGMELDRRIGHLFRFRGERAVRWEVYWSPGEALRAAGLDEQGERGESRRPAGALSGRRLAPRGSRGRYRGPRPCP